MKKVQIEGAPKPAGHYSSAVIHNGFIFVSGQLPTDPSNGQVVEGGIEPQAEQAIRNVERVLQAAGSDLDHVVQMTVYIADGDLWGPVNDVYARIFGDHRPARAIIPVKEMHHGSLIEIQAIAAV
jgi:2-iminobutanoate/2-iminopropanoate deaminase